MAFLYSKIADFRVRFSYGAQSGAGMPPIPHETIIFWLHNGGIVTLSGPVQGRAI